MVAIMTAKRPSDAPVVIVTILGSLFLVWHHGRLQVEAIIPLMLPGLLLGLALAVHYGRRSRTRAKDEALGGAKWPFRLLADVTLPGALLVGLAAKVFTLAGPRDWLTVVGLALPPIAAGVWTSQPGSMAAGQAAHD